MINKTIDRIKPMLCEKVLPTAYDNSLSYYEVLCKLTEKVNEVIEGINDNFSSEIANAIDKYFNTLMMEAIYDSATETITLEKEISADGEHVYNVEEQGIEVRWLCGNFWSRVYIIRGQQDFFER